MWEGNRNSTKKQAFKKTKLAIHMAAYVYSAGLVVEILENLINECENLDCRAYFSNNVGMWVSNEKEPKTDFRVFSPKQEEDQRLLLIHSEGKAWREYQDGEIEKLNRRLQILEDDAEVMKRAFFTSVEERKLFIHEIHGLFQIVHHFLCLQSQGRAEKEEHAGALIINPHKNRRMGSGLSQVLIQDSNPALALVTRGLRADMLPPPAIPGNSTK